MTQEIESRLRAQTELVETMLQDHHSLAASALTLIQEKLQRVERRLAVLAKRKAESEFAMEMAFEEEMPADELEYMQAAAAKCDAESVILQQQKQGLMGKMSRIDDDDLKCTNHILDYKHPSTEVARAQQAQALEYRDKLAAHTQRLQQIGTPVSRGSGGGYDSPMRASQYAQYTQ